MNRIFRLKFDRRSQQLIVVSELATRCANATTTDVTNSVANLELDIKSLSYSCFDVNRLAESKLIANPAVVPMPKASSNPSLTDSALNFECNSDSNCSQVDNLNQHNSIAVTGIPSCKKQLSQLNTESNYDAKIVVPSVTTNEHLVVDKRSNTYFDLAGATFSQQELDQLVVICQGLEVMMPILGRLDLESVGQLKTATSFFMLKKQDQQYQPQVQDSQPIALATQPEAFKQEAAKQEVTTPEATQQEVIQQQVTDQAYQSPAVNQTTGVLSASSGAILQTSVAQEDALALCHAYIAKASVAQLQQLEQLFSNLYTILERLNRQVSVANVANSANAVTTASASVTKLPQTAQLAQPAQTVVPRVMATTPAVALVAPQATQLQFASSEFPASLALVNPILTSPLKKSLRYLATNLTTVASLALLTASPGYALTNGQVVHGNAQIDTNGLLTTITSHTDKTIINWESFNIGTNEVVSFIQNNAHSSVLNRVLGDQVSQILGQLKSNGQVFLINPNGIVFGKGAVVDTQGLIASTLNISDQDYLADKLHFAAKDQAIAAILNQGLISVAKDGTLALIGGKVTNQGILQTANGDIMLLAGQEIVIADLHNPLISYKVVAGNSAINLSSVLAGGNVKMLAQQISNQGSITSGLTSPTHNSVPAATAGANPGSIAQAVVSINGTVELIAVNSVADNNALSSNGNANSDNVNSATATSSQASNASTSNDAASSNANGLANSSFVGHTGTITAHQVTILGDHLSLDGNATITALGNTTAGGQILVGGADHSQRHDANVAPLVTAHYQDLTKLGNSAGSSASNSASNSAANSATTGASIGQQPTSLYINSGVKLLATAAQPGSLGTAPSGGDKQSDSSQLTAPVISLYARRAYYDGSYEVASGLVETSAQKFSLGKQLNITTHGGEWLLDPLDIRIINATAPLFYTFETKTITPSSGATADSSLTNPTSKYTEGDEVTLSNSLKSSATVPTASGSSSTTTSFSNGVGKVEVAAPVRSSTAADAAAALAIVDPATYGAVDTSRENVAVTGSSIDNSSNYFYRVNFTPTQNAELGSDTAYITTLKSGTASGGVSDSDALTSFVSDSYLSSKLNDSHITLLTNKGNITASGVTITADKGYSLRLMTGEGFINLDKAKISLGNGSTQELAGRSISPAQTASFGRVNASVLGLWARDAIIVSNSDITAAHLTTVTQGNVQISDSKVQAGFLANVKPQALSQTPSFAWMGNAYVPSYPESYVVTKAAAGNDYSLSLSNVSFTVGNASRVLVNNDYATNLNNVSFTFDKQATVKPSVIINTKGVALAGNLSVANNALIINSNATNNSLGAALLLQGDNVTIDSSDNASTFINLYGKADSTALVSGTAALSSGSTAASDQATPSRNPTNQLIVVAASQESGSTGTTATTATTSTTTGSSVNLTVKGTGNYFTLAQHEQATNYADLRKVNLQVADNASLRLRLGTTNQTATAAFDSGITTLLRDASGYPEPTLVVGKVTVGNAAQLAVVNHPGDEVLVAANQPNFTANPVGIHLADSVAVGAQGKLNLLSQGNISIAATANQVVVNKTAQVNLQARKVNISNTTIVNQGSFNITGLVAASATVNSTALASNQKAALKELTLATTPSNLQVNLVNSSFTNAQSSASAGSADSSHATAPSTTTASRTGVAHEHGVVTMQAPLGSASMVLNPVAQSTAPVLYGQDVAVNSLYTTNLKVNGAVVDSKLTTATITPTSLNNSYSYLSPYYGNNLLQANSPYIKPVDATSETNWLDVLLATPQDVTVTGNLSLIASTLELNSNDNVYLGLVKQSDANGATSLATQDLEVQMQDSDILISTKPLPDGEASSTGTAGSATGSSSASSSKKVTGVIALGNLTLSDSGNQGVTTSLPVTNEHKGANNVTLNGSKVTVSDPSKVNLSANNLALNASDSYLTGNVTVKNNLTATGNLTLSDALAQVSNVTVTGTTSLNQDAQLQVANKLTTGNLNLNYASVVANELVATDTTALENNATLVVKQNLSTPNLNVAGSLVTAGNATLTNLTASNASIGVSNNLTAQDLSLNQSILGAVHGAVTVTNSTQLANHASLETATANLTGNVNVADAKLAAKDLAITGNLTAANATVTGNNLTINKGTAQSQPGGDDNSTSPEQQDKYNVVLENSSIAFKQQANITTDRLLLNGTNSQILAPHLAIATDELTITNTQDLAIGGDQVSIAAEKISLSNDNNIQSKSKLQVTCNHATNYDCNGAKVNPGLLAQLQGMLDNLLSSNLFSAAATGLSGSGSDGDGDAEASEDGEKSESSESSENSSGATGTSGSTGTTGSETTATPTVTPGSGSKPTGGTSGTSSGTNGGQSGTSKPGAGASLGSNNLTPALPNLATQGNVGSRNQALREELRTRNNITAPLTQTTALPTAMPAKGSATNANLVGVTQIDATTRPVPQPSVTTLKTLQQQGVATQALPYGASDKQFNKVEQVDIHSIFSKLGTDVATSVSKLQNGISQNSGTKARVTVVTSPTNINNPVDEEDALAVIEKKLKEAKASQVKAPTAPNGNVNFSNESVQILVQQATAREISILNSGRRKAVNELLNAKANMDNCTAGGASGIAICKATAAPTTQPAGRVVNPNNLAVLSSNSAVTSKVATPNVTSVAPVKVQGSTIAPQVIKGHLPTVGNIATYNRDAQATANLQNSRLQAENNSLTQFTKANGSEFTKRLVTADGKVIYIPDPSKRPSFRTQMQFGSVNLEELDNKK